MPTLEQQFAANFPQEGEEVAQMDYSKLSNEELASMAGVQLTPQKTDYSQMSNEELIGIAGLPKKDALQAQFNSKKAGIGRTILDQGLQGATLGAGSTATDMLGTIGANIYATLDPSIDRVDLPSYTETRDNTAARLENELKTQPELSIGSNIAGALLTGGAGATTKAGTALANSVRSGNLAARVGKGAIAGGASGGIYGFNSGEGGLDERLESAGKNAELGAAFGVAAPVIGATVGSVAKTTGNIYKGFKARDVEELENVAKSIRDESGVAYKAMRDSGAILNRPRAVNITNQVESAIKSSGKLNQGLHGKTLSVLNDFKEAARNADFTVEDLDQFRQLFREVVESDTAITGKVGGDGFKALEAINKIDDAVDNLAGIDIRGGRTDALDALEVGRKTYQKARKFEAITDIVKKSKGDEVALKRGLTKFAEKAKNTRGWSGEELGALDKAASRNGTESILRGLGTFGFDLGKTKNIALPVLTAGGGLAIPGGIGLTAVGTVARQANKLAAKGGVEDLLKVIQAGGKVSPRQINSLSKAQQLQVLQALKTGGNISTSTVAKVTGNP